MSASHTSTKNTKSTKNPTESGLVGRRFTLVPEVGLVDRDAHDHARLVQRLAGRVGEELVTFAERMREGLLAASVGIGLEVLGS